MRCLSEFFWRHSWDIFSSAFALWNKLEISVNIDARILKFGMEHPLTESLRFRKNQLGGPCGAHVWAIKWPGFVYFYCIFALLVWNVSNFYSNPVRPTEEYPVLLNNWNHVGVMFGPFWTMSDLALLPDQLELWNFPDWVNKVLGTFLWSVYFLGPYEGRIGTILVPCLV